MVFKMSFCHRRPSLLSESAVPKDMLANSWIGVRDLSIQLSLLCPITPTSNCSTFFLVFRLNSIPLAIAFVSEIENFLRISPHDIHVEIAIEGKRGKRLHLLHYDILV